MAAPVRPNPECSTQSITPPPASGLPAGLGLADEAGFEQLVARVRQLRSERGLAVARWTSRTLASVVTRAVEEEQWPAASVVPALLIVAADRETRSPARLLAAGPWWDAAEQAARVSTGPAEQAELAELEAVLAEAGGERVLVQRMARDRLSRAGEPLSRLAVARLALQLLTERRAVAS